MFSSVSENGVNGNESREVSSIAPGDPSRPTAFTAIAAGVQSGVWSHLTKCEGAFNASDLATELKMDSSLLCEHMRQTLYLTLHHR
ncbi:unnamed protein product [Clonostachys rosea]|uniref:Uncharacterized protein n=1 Tax=Bionectria ochroleuca TaxID=29856 RepID=A0ABY6UBF1_BIOOC|nr:unnamed protein product [Clonostachys rosea]